MQRTPLTIPPIELIADEVAQLARTAQAAGDTTAINTFNRAAEQLALGVRPILSAGDVLIPSRTQAGATYRVTALGCSCPAGLKGRACWHAALMEGIASAWDRLAEMDDALDTEAEPAPEPAPPALRIVPRDFDDDAGWADMLAAA